MCQQSDESPGRIRISRCEHGTYHLSLKGVTLHLSAVELVNLTHLTHESMHRYGPSIREDVKRERQVQPEGSGWRNDRLRLN